MITYVLLLAAATAEKPVKIRQMEPPPIQCSTIVCSAERPKPEENVTNDSSNEHPHPAPPIAPPSERIYVRPPTAATRAIPRNNPGGWVGSYDYPTYSLAYEEEGTTGFRLTIGVDGKVSACSITSTSGFELLDAAACKNITRRARFSPALDNDGNPIEGNYSNRVIWRIPAMPSFAQQTDLLPAGPQATFGVRIEISELDYPLEALEKGVRGQTSVLLSISEMGDVTNCSVKTGTGNPALDAQSCKLASSWTFLPARDAVGKAIVGETTHDFVWILPDAWKEYQKTGLYPKKSVE